MDHDLARQFPCPIPPFSAYAEALAGTLAKHFGRQQGPELIIEPGLAVVADAMHYVAQINHLKRAGDRTMALASGSVYHIKPTLSAKNLPVTLVRAPSGKSMSPAGPVDIAGYTCMENDLLYRGYEGPVRPGDFAVFSNVGAYTLVLSPSFIRPRPAILVCDEQGRVIATEKRAESTADVFASFPGPGGTQAP